MISRFLQLNASVQYTIIPFYLKHGTQHKELGLEPKLFGLGFVVLTTKVVRECTGTFLF